jgi:hypothetical protein
MTAALYNRRVNSWSAGGSTFDDIIVFGLPLFVGVAGFVWLRWRADKTQRVDELLPVVLAGTAVAFVVMVVTIALLVRYVGS